MLQALLAQVLEPQAPAHQLLLQSAGTLLSFRGEACLALSAEAHSLIFLGYLGACPGGDTELLGKGEVGELIEAGTFLASIWQSL